MNNQCRYCKEEGHIAKECPKLAKRQKLDNDPDAPRCSHCNTIGHEELNCYFGANMENCPPKWTLTEIQQKLINEYKKSNKPINPKLETFNIEGFKLIKPRLQTTSDESHHKNNSQQMTGSIRRVQNL